VLTFDDGPSPGTDERIRARARRGRLFGADIFAGQLPKSTPQRLLPAFLRYLRDNRCRVVHVVSKAPASAAAETRRIEKR
jgi:hypothetical protein